MYECLCVCFVVVKEIRVHVIILYSGSSSDSLGGMVSWGGLTRSRPRNDFRWLFRTLGDCISELFRACFVAAGSVPFSSYYDGWRSLALALVCATFNNRWVSTLLRAQLRFTVSLVPRQLDDIHPLMFSVSSQIDQACQKCYRSK